MRRLSQLPTSQGSDGESELDRLSAAKLDSLNLDGSRGEGVATPAGVLSECAPLRFRDPQIEMAHGAGGKASRKLVEGLFAPLLFGAAPGPLGDAAHVDVDGTKVAITTDSFVVKPITFPGGSIGELAVNGTVNDLAVSGARALALVVSYVLEAGLPTSVLEAEVRAMAKAARQAGIRIAAGDTKVVEHGKADQMYVTTTGIGRLIPGVTIDPASVRVGDKILLSGPIGDHVITILLARRT
jgi:hydrogenase expression/formation protein HypE